MPILTRTVVVPSVPLTEKKLKIFKEFQEIYSEILLELVEFGFKKGIKSFTGLKKQKYRELRQRHSNLPSHYIYTACQDASTRIKSFLKLKKKGIARTEKPEVKKVSIWLDDHLWKMVDRTTIKIATHKGWIFVPLVPHKLYWKYINTGWKMKSQPKIRLDEKSRRLLVYFVFEREVKVQQNLQAVISVDINESNVTVKVGRKVFILLSDIKRLTLGYASYREAMQSFRGNKYVKKTVKDNERNRKKDRRMKLANIIAETAKQLNAVVAVENLPKRCPENMIRDVKNSKLRHRIYQAGFRSLIKAIEEKCLERGILVVKVNPKGTSSVCPICGYEPMRGYAPRLLLCPRCNLKIGRDVVAVMNIEKRAFQTLKGSVPLGPMPYDSAPEVAVLPMKEWMREKSLPPTLNDFICIGMKR